MCFFFKIESLDNSSLRREQLEKKQTVRRSKTVVDMWVHG